MICCRSRFQRSGPIKSPPHSTVGVALLLCNLWADLHCEVFSTGALCETELWLAAVRLLRRAEAT